MGKSDLSILPRMDALLASPALADSGLPRSAQKAGANRVLDQLRQALRAGETQVPELHILAQRARQAAEELARPGLRRVVNATGVALHTNLGRAPLSPRAVTAVVQAAEGYSNLEYDLSAGRRGSRTGRVEELLRELTGAEGAFAVNNNAAAVLLMLSALTPGIGVAISRGELVEIGGSFRVPDVMARSGARLVEVGATNKTRLSDYERVLESGEAQALLKVHPSNFKVVGFTQSVAVEELAALADRYQVPLLCDLGSGALGPGLWPQDYPTVEQWAAAADVVCFSGDKLLGGPQAGILVGRGEAIRRLKSDPLARALRLDKLSLAALEATLLDWRDGVSVPARPPSAPARRWRPPERRGAAPCRGRSCPPGRWPWTRRRNWRPSSGDGPPPFWGGSIEENCCWTCVPCCRGRRTSSGMLWRRGKENGHDPGYRRPCRPRQDRSGEGPHRSGHRPAGGGAPQGPHHRVGLCPPDPAGRDDGEHCGRARP